MTTVTEKKTKYKHAPHAAWRKVGEEAIVLDLNTSVYYSLNETASRMWEELGKGSAASDVVEEVSREFEVSEDQAGKDLDELIKNLCKESLLLKV